MNKPASHRDLITGFILIIGLLLALAGVGLFYLNALNQTITRIVEVNNEKTRLATAMYLSARDRALQLHAILQEDDPFARDELMPHFHELAGTFRGAREALLRMPLSPLERELLRQQLEQTSRGSLAQDAVLDMIRADNDEEAKQVLSRIAIPAQNQAIHYLRLLQGEQERTGRVAASGARDRYRVARAPGRQHTGDGLAGQPDRGGGGAPARPHAGPVERKRSRGARHVVEHPGADLVQG